MMKQTLTILGVTALLLVITYVGLRPGDGVLYQYPMATLGVSLIGLGLCMEARKRFVAQAQPATAKS